MTITGRMEWQDIEGGFWGLVGDDGKKYRPMNADSLDASLLENGRRVRVSATRDAGMSISMWGINISVQSAEAVS